MIRPATSDDQGAIRGVNDAAFGRPDEGRLVDQLRADGNALTELVADENGCVVGHILFSRLRLHGPDVLPVAALAPMSVQPDLQRSGVGSSLVLAGIAECRDRSLPAIVVLGHPEFYPRFGFSAEAASRLKAPFSGPAFMALNLEPGALDDHRVVQYSSAFGLDGWFRKHGPR